MKPAGLFRRRDVAKRAHSLAYVTQRGGRTRGNKYTRDVRKFIVPVLLITMVQGLVYITVTIRPGREDWGNILATCAVLAAVPFIAAGLLTAFRRHEAPILIAATTSAIVFSIAVTALSALRIPISYQGLFACLPVAAIGMAYANLQFHRTIDRKAGLIPCSRAEEVAREADVPILSAVDEELSDVEVLLFDPIERPGESWSQVIATCYLNGIEVVPWTHYLEIRRGRLDVDSFNIAHLAYSPSQLLYARFKHVVDLALVLVSLPLAIPVAGCVAAYIFMRDGGPVIFVQLRRGQGGKPFRMYKFRTMYKGSSGGATTSKDKRIIPGCARLRKLRLDELPQLYNILRGDMSLIGPRPEAIDLARWYSREIPKYSYRELILPGLTGWAQVKGGYTSNPDEAKVKLSYDLYYIKHMSFDLDLQIVFKTIRTVFSGFGAR